MPASLADSGAARTSFGCARSVGAAVCFALVLPSCGADLSALHPSAQVTCKWTIAHATDATGCASVRSSNVHIEVFLAGNTTGLFDKVFDAPCTDFVTTMDLLPGGYYAFATLEDTNGQPRGVVTRIHPFNARSDTEVAVIVDFPRSSIYP
jgi:hypothetical protein